MQIVQYGNLDIPYSSIWNSPEIQGCMSDLYAFSKYLVHKVEQQLPDQYHYIDTLKNPLDQ